MASDLQHEGLDFCKTVFETVRQMSAEGRGVTRQGYGPVECKVVEYLKSVGRDLNLEICDDAAGNVWMRLPGIDPSLPAFVSGSHADSVPEGGNYDGLAGVTAALAVAWWMRRTHFTPKRDYSCDALRRVKFLRKGLHRIACFYRPVNDQRNELKAPDGRQNVG